MIEQVLARMPDYALADHDASPRPAAGSAPGVPWEVRTERGLNVAFQPGPRLGDGRCWSGSPR